VTEYLDQRLREIGSATPSSGSSAVTLAPAVNFDDPEETGMEWDFLSDDSADDSA
jgi:hypothetical protein